MSICLSKVGSLKRGKTTSPKRRKSPAYDAAQGSGGRCSWARTIGRISGWGRSPKTAGKQPWWKFAEWCKNPRKQGHSWGTTPMGSACIQQVSIVFVESELGSRFFLFSQSLSLKCKMQIPFYPNATPSIIPRMESHFTSPLEFCNFAEDEFSSCGIIAHWYTHNTHTHTLSKHLTCWSQLNRIAHVRSLCMNRSHSIHNSFIDLQVMGFKSARAPVHVPAQHLEKDDFRSWGKKAVILY